MSMTKCRECGAPISTKAQACPRCGAARKLRTSATTGCLVLAVAILAIPAGLVFLGAVPTRPLQLPPQTATTDRDVAFAAIADAKQRLSQMVRDPSSLQWRDVSARRSADGAVLVCGWFNAKNAFGAYVGFVRFIGVGTSVFLEEDPAKMDAAWSGYCSRATILHRLAD